LIITPAGTGIQTGSDGRFVLSNIQKDALLHFSCIGYKNQTVKADFTSDMVIRMEIDPNYKSTVMTPDATFIHEGQNVTIRITGDKTMQSLVVIDEKVTNFIGEVKLKRDDIGSVNILKDKEATDKYGEKGKYGVVEIITKKRADELGIKPPEPKPVRMNPEDYPTFQGKSRETFEDWVIKNLKYPDDADKKKIQGRITVSFNVEGDGSIGTVTCVGLPNPILKDAVIKAVQNSPKWEPAKNPGFNNPMPLQISIKFVLPDKVLKDDALNFVDVMPSYPGGEDALKRFINDNLRYPSDAKANNIQGRVSIRFVITKEGNVEDPIIIRSINSLLDAEAVRVISLLTGWKPGMQEGKPVNVNFIMPVEFKLQ
jgi:TonB family protein